MVDAADSKSALGDKVLVRVQSSAQIGKLALRVGFPFFVLGRGTKGTSFETSGRIAPSREADQGSHSLQGLLLVFRSCASYF